MTETGLQVKDIFTSHSSTTQGKTISASWNFINVLFIWLTNKLYDFSNAYYIQYILDVWIQLNNFEYSVSPLLCTPCSSSTSPQEISSGLSTPSSSSLQSSP